MLRSALLALAGIVTRRAPAFLLAGACTLATAQSTPACFEVSSPTGKVYVLGSIHVGRKDFYPLPPAVEEAWKTSKSLAVEADVSDPSAMMALAPLMVCAPPDSLDQHLSAEGWKKVEAHFKNPKITEGLKKIGLPEAALKRFRPWALATTLAVLPVLQGGFDLASGIDMHFLQRAKRENRAILQLESADFQAKLLSGLPKATQEAFLLEILEGLGSGKAIQELNKLVEVWAKGDVDQIHRLIQDASTNPEMKVWMRSLLEGRHPGMVEKIAGYLASPDPVFVVVGAAHVAGPEGVIELLKRRGFKVKRLS